MSEEDPAEKTDRAVLLDLAATMRIVALNVDTLVDGARGTNVRLGLIEARLDKVEDRADKTSMRVRDDGTRASQADLDIQARQAEEITKRQQLERDITDTRAEVRTIAEETRAQTAILSQLAKVAANPFVKVVATAVGTAILSYLSMKGLR